MYPLCGPGSRCPGSTAGGRDRAILRDDPGGKDCFVARPGSGRFFSLLANRYHPARKSAHDPIGGGVGLIAVTALLVSWVTVGIVQLPAESLMLGGRFAVYRNLVCFGIAVIVAFLVVYTLQLLRMA